MGEGETNNGWSTREVCGPGRVDGGMNSKSMWWSDEVKASVKRKEVLGSRYEEAKEVTFRPEKGPVSA